MSEEIKNNILQLYEINFQKYKKDILKKLMEICILTDSEALLTLVNSENKYIVFSSTKFPKYFIFNYLLKDFEDNIIENYNLKDVKIIFYIIFFQYRILFKENIIEFDEKEIDKKYKNQIFENNFFFKNINKKYEEMNWLNLIGLNDINSIIVDDKFEYYVKKRNKYNKKNKFIKLIFNDDYDSSWTNYVGIDKKTRESLIKEKIKQKNKSLSINTKKENKVIFKQNDLNGIGNEKKKKQEKV